MTAAWTFRPPWWAIAATLVGCVITIDLGLWQWRRGDARVALDQQYEGAAGSAAVALRADTEVLPGADAQAVFATGRYDSSRQLLLDNQVSDRIPGYHVLTPIALDSGGIALVNRGWVPQNPDRRVLPKLSVDEGPVKVTGLWRSLPQPAYKLAIDNCAASAEPWPRIVGYPTPDDLQCLYGKSAASGMLLLAPTEPDGFVRNWRQDDRRFPPQRHYGYAAQWFAFAATLLAIFIKLNLKRRTP